MKQGLAESMAFMYTRGLIPFSAWGEGIPSYVARYSDPLEGVDIKYEYQLIIRKISKLPASQRREVVRRWHKSQERTAPT